MSGAPLEAIPWGMPVSPETLADSGTLDQLAAEFPGVTSMMNRYRLIGGLLDGADVWLTTASGATWDEAVTMITEDLNDGADWGRIIAEIPHGDTECHAAPIIEAAFGRPAAAMMLHAATLRRLGYFDLGWEKLAGQMLGKGWHNVPGVP